VFSTQNDIPQYYRYNLKLFFEFTEMSDNHSVETSANNFVKITEDLEEEFKLLKYHPDSSRMLTFNEYKKIRNDYWHIQIHCSQLYIIEDDKFSVLMSVDHSGYDLHYRCDLKFPTYTI
jgi:hypothetical protein